LLHSGTNTGGLLTSLLYFVFDLVILSGVAGIIAYIVSPRIMTRIEGEPLLVEDLEKRREELREQSKSILDQSEGWLKDEIRDRIYARFLSRGFLWRQLSRREELKSLLAQARQEFTTRTTRLATNEERDRRHLASRRCVVVAASNAAFVDSDTRRFNSRNACVDGRAHRASRLLQCPLTTSTSSFATT
jgi:hypothetical protein